jgi:hypothetical protein
MKLKTTIITTSFLAACFIAISGTMNQSGPGPGLTNAPNESNCTSCHSGSLVTSGSNWNNIRLNGGFTGGGYIPDSVYTIEITHKQTGISKFGFQVTPLIKSNNAPAGSISVSSNRVQRYTSVVNNQTRQYAGHTSTGTSSVSTDSTHWFFTWTAPSSNVGDIVFYVVVNSTNSNNNQSGDQIFAKTFEISPSTLLPTASASSIVNSTCSGYEVDFQGSGTNNTISYQWQFTGGQPSSSTTQNPTVKFVSPGIQYAILRVTNDKGQSAPDSFEINVLPSPAASISGSASYTICEGDSVFLSAANVSGATYSWSPSNQTGREVWVKDPGEHRVTVTRTTTGCSAVSNPVTLFVNPISQIHSLTTASGTDSFCATMQDTVKAVYDQADSFFWTVNNVTTKTISGSFPVNATASTNVTVQAKGSNGCLSMPSVISLKVVKPINPLNLTGTATSTSEISLTWGLTPGALGYQLSLDSGQTYTSSSLNTFADITGLAPNTQYRFYIKTLQNGPCHESDTSIEVTTLPCSNISFNIVSDSAICFGEFLNVVVRGLSNEYYGVSFDNGGTYTTDTIFSTKPFADGIVILKIIDSAELACPPITRNISYKVVSPINDNINKPDVVTICSNEEFVYEVVQGYKFLDFYLNNNLVSSGTSHAFSYSGLSDGDSVYAIGTLGPCMLQFKTVQFNVNPGPESGFSYVRNHKTYQFTANETGGDVYEWNFGDGNTAAVQNPTHTYMDMNKEVSVSLKVSFNNNCESLDTQQVLLPDVTSLAVLKKLDMAIYPNPFRDYVSISNENSFDYVYELTNLLGQKIIKGKSDHKELKIQTVDLTPGVYILTIKSSGNFANVTLVKY